LLRNLLDQRRGVVSTSSTADAGDENRL